MKKIILLIAFAFIGRQAFSQMYIVTITTAQLNSASPCYAMGTMTTVMHTIDPQGNVATTCLSYTGAGHNAEDLSIINLEFNSIINQGYRLISNSLGNLHDASGQWGAANIEGTYYFAIP